MESTDASKLLVKIVCNSSIEVSDLVETKWMGISTYFYHITWGYPRNFITLQTFDWSINILNMVHHLIYFRETNHWSFSWCNNWHNGRRNIHFAVHWSILTSETLHYLCITLEGIFESCCLHPKVLIGLRGKSEVKGSLWYKNQSSTELGYS